MNDIFSQLRFGLEVAWYKIRYAANSNGTLLMAAAVVILVAWIFLSPAVRKKSS